MEILSIPVKEINPALYNPRKDLQPGDPEYEKLKKSILEFDMVEPLVWNKQTGNLVGGHQRLKILVALGTDKVDVSVVDLPPVKEKALNIALNKIQGAWDFPKLKDLLEELDTGDFDIEITGFDVGEIEELMTQFHVPSEGDGDKIPQQVDAICKVGDLWQLGGHRLLCGDATKQEDVERLVGGDKPLIMSTDPPYGIWLDHTWRDKVGINRKGKGHPDTIKGDEPTFDWTVAFALSKCAVAYVWHGALHGDAIQAQLKNAGYEVRQQIIWNKDQAPLGRAAYHWKHETCWYAVLKGNKAYWVGDRTQTTVWECASPKHIMGGSKDGKFDHPTQKPVLLTEIPLNNHTHLGDICYDPFGGSGSTLIACEKLGRRCFMMEIDEHYCDVIIQRWQDFTGRIPERLDE